VKPRIFVFHRLPEPIEAILEKEFAVEWNRDDQSVPVERLIEIASRTDAIVPTVTDPVPAEVVEAAGRRIGLVANFGVGVNLIDLDAASRAGVVVTNTPGVLTDATADLTIGLILMVLRRLGEGERLVRSGRWTGWRPTHLLGRDLSGLTLGVIGFGRIGRAVARRARLGFGMRIISHTRREVPAPVRTEVGAEPRDLDELLGEADLISLHCPLTPETDRLIDANRLARFKHGAVLINTARGGLVSEPDLIRSLKKGELAGAGFDVYREEPMVPSELIRLENVVLLPHLGSATVETRTAMGRLVVENLRAFFAGSEPPNRVV
jgi:lactate dehydrogenase-like 2-hydroxyacid dehydrogenase